MTVTVIILFLVLLCACTAQVEVYMLAYVSEPGGMIYGNIYQEIEEGESGTQVVAVANEGYEFVGWSDGAETPARIEVSVTESATLTAKFKKIIVHTLEYFADIGGSVVGDAIQYICNGESGNTISVSTKNGYRFIKWSDGIETKTRKEIEVENDLSVVAQFEAIIIKFYSGEYLVREMNLAEINLTDISKYIGYSSKSEFLGWKYRDEQLSNGVFIDALYSIKQQFNRFGISDIKDIELQAVYGDMSGGGGIIPDNCITISHALGGYKNEAYTNSLEAFKYNYDLGQRFFEVDFTVTADGVFIASHDWMQFSYDEKRVEMAERGLTLLDLSALIEILNNYKDIYIDLDVLGICKGNISNDNDEIYKRFYIEFDTLVGSMDSALYDRIILEILPNTNTQMFDYAKKYSGLKNFLYAEYYGSSDPMVNDEAFQRVGQYCKDNEIKYLSIQKITAQQVEILHKYGVYVMVFTYNEPIKMYEFFDMGVDCIFTDFCFM